MSDVIVKLTGGGRTLAFTSSNVKGEYTLELKSLPKGEVMLQFNHISFEKESEALTLKDRLTKVDMMLTPKSISLKEVMVRPDPLRQRGDTLSLHLASFLGKGDVTLEDGLKRLPGVDVSRSGTISYMGRNISQFNIEGLDLLGGKYNLATQNIPADYVTNVEIVRNHHSQRIDRDVPSNEVSMNIRLSKNVKLKPFGQEGIGTGYKKDGYDKVLALLGVTGMLFTDKFQTICSLKAGNYKNFASDDMIDHFGDSDISTRATSSGIIGETDTWYSSGDWKLQLPLQYFTLRLAAGHSEGKRNMLYAQSVSGIDVSSSALRHDTHSRSTNFSVSSTKNFPSVFTKLGADAAYGFGDREQAIASSNGSTDIIKVRSNYYSLHGNASVTPIQWLELHYDIRYGWSRTRYSDERNTVTSLSHSGAVHVFPIATLDLSMDYDYVRRQIASDQYKHMSLFNASAQYKWKRCVLRLEITNLLNQRSYSYTVFDGINTYS